MSTVNVAPQKTKKTTSSVLKVNTREEILARLEESRTQFAEGKFTDAREVSREMRAKYGV